MWSGTPRTHRPGPGRVVPTSTYRLQLHAGFGFADAAAISPYLSELGVSHLYLSPILEPQPGSTHGYSSAPPTPQASGSSSTWSRIT